MKSYIKLTIITPNGSKIGLFPIGGFTVVDAGANPYTEILILGGFGKRGEHTSTLFNVKESIAEIETLIEKAEK